MSKKKEKKAKKQEIKRVDIEVTLPLSDKEKVKRGELACAKLTERDRLELERTAVSKDYLAQIKTLDSQAHELLRQFETGEEKTTVNALERKNFEKGQVDYLFKGKVVKTREMTYADRQQDLPLKGEKTADAKPAEAKAETVTRPEPAPKPVLTEDKACVATPGKKPPRGQRQPITEEDEDIASTHREETSRLGSYSCLNGARA